MARITVKDCLQQIPNRFQLVLAATYRARMLHQGHAPKLESSNRPNVTALREIAAGHMKLEIDETVAPDDVGRPQGSPLRRKTVGQMVGAFKSITTNEYF